MLVDCGLFQGLKRLREMNWAPFPVDPASLDAVLLTHAHIDHSGYLPALVRDGFRGRIWCTPATAGLARILLPDVAHLQEEDARYANKRRSSRHDPALPLFTVEDVDRTLPLEIYLQRETDPDAAVALALVLVVVAVLVIGLARQSRGVL